MAYADTAAGAIILESGPRFIVTAGAAIEAGDLVGYSSGYVLALATVGTAIKAQWVALHKAASGAQVQLSRYAIVKGRSSGATVGGAVYLAEGTAAGDSTQTQPATSGDVDTQIGVAIAADTNEFSIPLAGAQGVAI